MNDNNGMRLEKFFHRVVVGVSAALILYGVVLAGTMIYGARQGHTPPGDADFRQLVAEQQGQEEPLPLLHPVPEFKGDGQAYPPSATTDMSAVPEEKRDDLALPLFNPSTEAEGEEGDESPEKKTEAEP